MSALVLVYDKYSHIYTGQFCSVDDEGSFWEIDGDAYDLDEVQFWCPIPKLPNGA